MANNIQLITKYAPEALDRVMTHESKSAILSVGEKFVNLDVKEAGKVKILSMTMDGLSDYNRAGHGYENEGYGKGSVTATWEEFKLKYDRGTQFKLDNMDDEETAGQVLGNLMTEFSRVHVVAEKDAITFSRIAGKTKETLGNYIEETIQANTIIGKLNSAFTYMTEQGVPETEQIVFVNPDVYALISSTTELNKIITQQDFTSDRGVKFTLPSYNGRAIVVVPSDRFFTNAQTTSNGYTASATSKIINFLVVSKQAVVPVVKLEKPRVFSPEVVQDFDGYKINYRLYHDVFVPKNKVYGLYASVSETLASTKVNTLTPDVEKDGDDYYVTATYTKPQGMNGKLVHSTSAFSLGTAYDDAEQIFINEPFNKLGATEYFALLDKDDKAIAISKAVTMPA